MNEKKADKTKSRRLLLWSFPLLVCVVLTVGGMIWYRSITLDAPIPDDAGDRYAGLEQGYTEQGFPRLGSADAPVVVEEFASFACPHCRDFDENQLPDLLDEIAAGDVQFVLIPMRNIGSGAEIAAKAALCAGEQNRFWEMHDVLFYWQQKFYVSVFSERRILDGAETMDLDMDAFKSCLDAERTQAVIEEAVDEFHRRDLTGTPSVFINGERVYDYNQLDDLP
jgi:protein-disulfide isomerase